jgi:class 3 adenylate cyclase
MEGAIAFTDIIASTALAERIGDAAWLQVMREQEDETSRLAAERDVEVVGCVGDGFLLQSPDPHRLVATGIALQRFALAADVPLRIGMHYGTYYCSLHTLVGFDVHVAARLTDLALAHEIVLSDLIAERTGLVGRTRVRMLRGVSRPCRFRTLTIDKVPN